MTPEERLQLTRKKVEVGSPALYISIYLNALTYSVVPEGQKIKITGPHPTCWLHLHICH